MILLDNSYSDLEVIQVLVSRISGHLACNFLDLEALNLTVQCWFLYEHSELEKLDSTNYTYKEDNVLEPLLTGQTGRQSVQTGQ